MSESSNLDIRDSRDDLSDLLGLGETYPLRDVGVTDELKVAFNTAAKITISPGQSRVTYELRDDDGDSPIQRVENGVLVPVAAPGDGEPLRLVTPPIAEDVTYTIRAVKQHTLGDGTTSLREVYLRRAVHLKVGLDLALATRVRLTDATLPLVAASTADGDERIIHHDTTVTVEIDGAQEGVDYDLVSVENGKLVARSLAQVRGKGEGITVSIDSTALREDLVLRVRATKKFTVAEARNTEVELLEALLPVKVRADPTVAVTALAAVIDHGKAAAIRVATTQVSATYQAYVHIVRDREFILTNPPASSVAIKLRDGHLVAIQRPPRADVWSDIAGFVPVGAPVAGTGEAIDLALGTLTADTLVIVRAAKTHTITDAAPTTSAVQALKAVAVLVRPDPAPKLALQVVMNGPQTTGTITVIGGQPGVYYQLRATPTGPDLGLPAYVHQRDDSDPGRNKGIDALAIEVDLAVLLSPAAAVAEPARQRPPWPVVDTMPLPVGTPISVVATRAMTRLQTALTATARIDAVPAIANERVGVDAGQPARIHIQPSNIAEHYRLLLEGDEIAAHAGDGATQVLVSHAVDSDTIFIVDVAPIVDPGIAVHRLVPVNVPLRPRADISARLVDGEPLAPGLAARIVDHAAPVRVTLDNSETDVDYRLVEVTGNGELTRSAADVRGVGGPIDLVITSADEDVDLRIRAIRRCIADAPESAQPQRLLDLVLPLKVRADPTRTVTIDPSPIVSFGDAPAILVAGSQRSARYALYTRPVTDADRLFGAMQAAATLTVAVTDEAPVRVIRPPRAALWADVAGFVAVGEALPGTGDALRLPLPALTTDLLVLIKAIKHHDPDTKLDSAIQLADAALILVTPDLHPALTLQVAIAKDTTLGTALLGGGETGVFYALQAEDAAPLGEPAYFHRKDGPVDRGIDQLRIGVDLVVPRDPGDAAALTRPSITTGPRPLGETWTVRATRADTRVTRPLPDLARILAPPVLVAEPTSIAAGTPARIKVLASVVGERYWLTRADLPFGATQDGTGGDLLLVGEALTQTTILTVHIVRSGALAVERLIEVEVRVLAPAEG